MKEIGGEFWYSLDGIINRDNDSMDIFNEQLGLKNKAIFLDSGRSCIRWCLEKIKTRYPIYDSLLPSYLCHTIIQPFKDANVKYSFFKINKKLEIDIGDLKNKIDKGIRVFYFINYFGFTPDKNTIELIKEFKRKNVIIIEDVTHSIFNENREYIGDFVIASLRKWFGIPDGGIVICNSNWNDDERVNVKNSYNNEFYRFRLIGHLIKNQYIEGIYNNKEVFLNFFRMAEDYLDCKDNINQMSNISKMLLNQIDLGDIIKKRKRNFNYLVKRLSYTNKIKPLKNYEIEDIVPLGFPVTVDNREGFKNYLIENRIYPPIHWNLPEEIDKDAYFESHQLSQNILTIPCDQRYTLEDMDYISKVIDEYRG